MLAVSERTKRDAIELYGLAPEKITVTPHGVDPAFTPGDGPHDGYLLFVGAVQARKDPLAALAAARGRRPAARRRRAREGAASSRGSCATAAPTCAAGSSKAELAELYRGAAALVLPSRFEGFGIPVLEAMASGTPVVLSDDPALREVAGDAGVVREDGDLAGAVTRVLADRDALRERGARARARASRGRRRRALTADVYRKVLA